MCSKSTVYPQGTKVDIYNKGTGSYARMARFLVRSVPNGDLLYGRKKVGATIVKVCSSSIMGEAKRHPEKSGVQLADGIGLFFLGEGHAASLHSRNS